MRDLFFYLLLERVLDNKNVAARHPMHYWHLKQMLILLSSLLYCYHLSKGLMWYNENKKSFSKEKSVQDLFCSTGPALKATRFCTTFKLLMWSISESVTLWLGYFHLSVVSSGSFGFTRKYTCSLTGRESWTFAGCPLPSSCLIVCLGSFSLIKAIIHWPDSSQYSL